MIKAIFGILVMAGAALGGAYWIGGVAAHDPTKTGNEVLGQITPGMTWQEVYELSEPGKFRFVQMVTSENPDGTQDVCYVAGNRRDFVLEDVRSDIERGAAEYGFIFQYYFSHQCAFSVWFDRDGQVESVATDQTIANFYD